MQNIIKAGLAGSIVFFGEGCTSLPPQSQADCRDEIDHFLDQTENLSAETRQAISQQVCLEDPVTESFYSTCIPTSDTATCHQLTRAALHNLDNLDRSLVNTVADGMCTNPLNDLDNCTPANLEKLLGPKKAL
jgi:hypothetical protein